MRVRCCRANTLRGLPKAPRVERHLFVVARSDGRVKGPGCTVAPIADPETVDEALEGMEFEEADRIMHEVTKPQGVPFPVSECPKCGWPDVPVKSSPKPKPGMPKIRYHACASEECGHRFNSVDFRKVEAG